MIRYGNPVSAPARGTPAPRLQLVCRCGGTWQGTARTDERFGDFVGDALPLTADPPCPTCHDAGNLAGVRPCS